MTDPRGTRAALAAVPAVSRAAILAVTSGYTAYRYNAGRDGPGKSCCRDGSNDGANSGGKDDSRLMGKRVPFVSKRTPKGSMQSRGQGDDFLFTHVRPLLIY